MDDPGLPPDAIASTRPSRRRFLTQVGVANRVDLVGVDATGGLRFSGDSGATWSTPTGSPLDIAPVALGGRSSTCMAIDAAANVRRTTNAGATWSTPVGSPII